MDLSPPISWLLDVDGVIFPDSRSTGWKGPVKQANIFSSVYKASFKVWWSGRLAKALKEIQESGLVQIIWCSSWCADADKVEKVLNLPSLDRAFPNGGRGHFDDKIQAAKRIHKARRRLIWTDDAVTPQWGDLYQNLTKDNQSLLITPDPDNGLQPEDIEQIKKFIGMEVE